MTLTIADNLALENIDGLSGVTSTKQILDIRRNDSLQNLNGLDNLVAARDIIIGANPSLSSIDGLANLGSVCNLTVSDNDALEGINVLSYVEPGCFDGSAGTLRIEFNNSLVDCQGLAPILGYPRVPLQIFI